MTENPNLAIAAFSAASSLITAIAIAWITNRNTTRNEDKRIQIVASEQEIKARADYVDLLQKRVIELEGKIDEAAKREREAALERWAREREAEDRCRHELQKLERMWRHLTTALVQWALILKIKLQEKGEAIPAFSGLKKFEEEGGIVPEQWRIGGIEQ